ncbi:hypothetical protein ACJMK2_010294 [Sinanodonta woodiana]|uniref:Transport and Golgi organization protein 6 homolog n=1 Tax=Sinanodonta woodiana TaxID=1069815 RepID=A0ABD3VEW2_SINWO
MAKHPDPAIVIEGLKILTSPDKSKAGTTSGQATVDGMEDALQRNIETFRDNIEKDMKFSKLKQICANKDCFLEIPSNSTTRWCFILHCLNLLHILQESIHEALREFKSKSKPENIHPSGAPLLSPDALGVGQQKIILTSVQFIVSLGICPYLQPGVGLPLEKRSEYGRLLGLSVEEMQLDDYQKTYRLFICIKVLMECINTPSLGSLILSRHLSDVLAMLLQLLYKTKPEINGEESNANTEKQSCISNNSKRTEPFSGESSPVNKDKEFGSNSSGRESCNKSRDEEFLQVLDEGGMRRNENLPCTIDMEFCEKSLKTLMERVYPPLLIRELMILQGGPRKQAESPVSSVLLPAPIWLRKACGQLLTQVIMRPQGVKSLLQGMLDTGATITGSKTEFTQTSDWRKCDAVAKVIACCPLQASMQEEYYRHVAPQILDIIHYPDKQIAHQFLRVACSTITQMLSQQAEMTESLIIRPLLQPLLSCTDTEDIRIEEEPVVIVEESMITACIEDISKVFFSVSDPNSVLLEFLRPIIHTVFIIYTFIREGVSHLRNPCLSILVSFMQGMESAVSITCLKMLALNLPATAGFRKMHPYLVLCTASQGGVMVNTKIPKSDRMDIGQEAHVQAVLDILKDLQRDGVTAEFFISLMKELTVLITHEVEKERRRKSEIHLPNLSSLEDHAQQKSKEVFFQKLLILNLLAAMCETLGPNCLQSFQHTVEFIKVTLERGIQVCNSTEDEIFGAFESETVTMAIGMLTAIMTGAIQMTTADRETLKELLPLLQELSTNHPDANVQEMAADIRIAIATHGAVWSEVMKSEADRFPSTSQTVKEKTRTDEQHKLISTRKSDRPKIEVLSGTDEMSSKTSANTYSKKSTSEYQSDSQLGTVSKKELENQTSSVYQEEKTQETGANAISTVRKDDLDVSSKNKSKLQKAFEELCDPLLPVRGHGLITLTKLLNARDPEALEKTEVILKIFSENLDHPDSYLYLAAVSGLVTLSDQKPDVIVPQLCTEFANFGATQSEIKRSSELRMKLGECLVKTCRKLGGTLPKYREMMLKAVLSGCKDVDPFIRASSLSNLGDVCKLLHFSLGGVVHEVFECCSSLLKTDKDVEVRKAGAMALALMLQGLGQDALKVLESVLRDLYQLLKFVMLTEKEEVVKLHVNLALNELDDIMKSFLFPKQTLKKRIRVLDPE